MQVEILEGRCLKYEAVGSRVTCDPAPTDTDQDILVLTTAALWAEGLGTGLAASGFEKGGSDCGNQADYLANSPMSFQSFTCGELNLIVTFDPQFYARFLAATGVAKMLNLQNKDDRVMLFQAVLYANDPRPLPPVEFKLAPIQEYIRPWWVSVKDAGSGCIEALNAEDACRIAGKLYPGEILSCEQIPYPASPRWHIEERDSRGVFPSFCYEPHRCKGRSSCPKRYSCTE